MRRDAARSAADFEQAARAKAPLADDNQLLKDKDPQEKNKSVASQTAIDKLIDFIKNLAKAAGDRTSLLPLGLIDPDAFKGLDQFIKGILGKYEDYGIEFGEWGEENIYYNALTARLSSERKRRAK